MTQLNIDYPSFEEYMARALSRKTRQDLRLKFRAAAAAPPITLTVVHDITPDIDEVYPLYLQVFERSKLRFEKLTREFLCELGRRMPDKVRYFIWRQEGRVIAFSLCMVEGERHLRRISRARLHSRPRAPPLSLRVPRRGDLGDREWLQELPQQRAQLRPEAPPALPARSASISMSAIPRRWMNGPAGAGPAGAGAHPYRSDAAAGSPITARCGHLRRCAHPCRLRGTKVTGILAF